VGERIVLGHAAVRIQPDHLAVVLAQILGAVALPALADGDEQMALRVERQTRAEVLARIHERLGREDHLQVLEPPLAQPGARDPRAVAAVAGGRVGEIDHPVRGESGIEGDVEQPALPARVDFRHALDRLRIEHPVAHYAHPSGALGNEDFPVRQERHAPRVLEAGHDRHDPERGMLGADRLVRPLSDRLLRTPHEDECRACSSQGCPQRRSRRSHAYTPPCRPFGQIGASGRRAHPETQTTVYMTCVFIFQVRFAAEGRQPSCVI
jgi:hypothetical protein